MPANANATSTSTLDMAALERALEHAVERAGRDACPPGLAAALRYAVFPGGARLRPKLLMAVARAAGGADLEVIAGAGAAVELMHCASLVHDDLPCFDDADTRRGRPSLPRAFGEPTAVLAGDGLIVLAFETLAHACAHVPSMMPSLIRLLAESAGSRRGLVAGQAWELEGHAPLSVYHRAKTGSLFEAAAAIGATLASSAHVDAWAAFGCALGEAYQAADDVADARGDASALGKPTARDAALGRPSAVREHGLPRAVSMAARSFEAALNAIPNVPTAPALRAWIEAEVSRSRVMAAATPSF